MVGQHPGRRRADQRDGRQLGLHGLAQGGVAPLGPQEVEVEGLAQLVGPDVAGATFRRGHPRLGDRHAVTGIAGQHLVPAPIDVVDVVAVPQRVVVAAPRGDVTGVVRLEVAQRVRLVLGETVGDVDAEAVHAAVQPEAQDRVELLADLGQLPVEVGLLGGEQVEVPLAVRHPGPGAATELGHPVGGRLGAVGTLPVAEDVPGACRAPGRRRECL